MSKHTPGPWAHSARLSASENHRGFDIYAAGWSLATVQPGDEDGELGTANARLIASAPEMLAALKDCREVLSLLIAPFKYSRELQERAVDSTNAAIAKAEGTNA